MMIDEIRAELFSLQDPKYRAFQIKLIPTVDPETVIGVRTPELRMLAKRLAKYDDIALFMNALPHKYFDENQLHAFIVSESKDFNQCVESVDRFLPFVDNWATCDQMSPKIFKRHRNALLEQIRQWIRNDSPYAVRFAIRMLMEHFLDDDFDIAYPEMVISVQSEEYYVRMMQAWYFATALAKQYAAVLPILEQHRLNPWTHRKTIQKAIESDRITPEQKECLRKLK